MGSNKSLMPITFVGVWRVLAWSVEPELDGTGSGFLGLPLLVTLG